MSKMKPVLGRGLASLIPRQPEVRPPVGADEGGTSVEVIVSIPVGQIERNPYQPRADFDPAALDELKRSIQEKGIIQPITVRRHGTGYQLISGERRLRAARDAGLTAIPAYIIVVNSDEEMLELALVENLQREHLNPIEIAVSYRRLIDECSLTQEDVSQRIGKDRTTVTNTLRLLKLPAEIQQSLRKGDLTTGHARALLAVEDDQRQLALFRKTIAKGLSVREVERLTKAKEGHKGRKSTSAGFSTSAAVGSIEDRLRRTLGTKVTLRTQQGGRGEIVIEYYSASDLERLLDLLAETEER
jgi:ParB family transcriptional regulator, chromosome partitioning protein